MARVFSNTTTIRFVKTRVWILVSHRDIEILRTIFVYVILKKIRDFQIISTIIKYKDNYIYIYLFSNLAAVHLFT